MQERQHVLALGGEDGANLGLLRLGQLQLARDVRHDAAHDAVLEVAAVFVVLREDGVLPARGLRAGGVDGVDGARRGEHDGERRDGEYLLHLSSSPLENLYRLRRCL